MITTSDFPQTDIIEQVGDVAVAVLKGNTTDESIEKFIKLDSRGRQGRYYRRSAEIIGLIINKQNHSVLTNSGKEYAKLKTKKAKNEFLAFRIIETPVFKEALKYINNIKPNEDKLKKWFLNFYPGSHETANRRFTTFISYLKVVNLISIVNNSYVVTKYSGALTREEHDPMRKLSGEIINSTIKKEFNPLKRSNIKYELDSNKIEQANQTHWKLVTGKSGFLYSHNFPAYGNSHIDLFSKKNNRVIIYEMKSMTSSNIISQIRKGIAQLYEYRYIFSSPSAKLCIVSNLNISKSDPWLIKYLSTDRQIAFEWTSDFTNFICDTNSKKLLDVFAP